MLKMYIKKLPFNYLAEQEENLMESRMNVVGNMNLKYNTRQNLTSYGSTH